MRSLKILDVPHASEWERYRLLPKALVRGEYRLNPCDVCSGLCCHFQVQLSAVEAVRIALTLSVPPLEAFVSMPYKFDPTTGQVCYHAIQLDDGDACLLFKRDPESKACTFKIDVGDYGRCGIYSLRPGICRMFPLHVEEEDGNKVAVGTDEHCPIGWLYDDRTGDRYAEELAAWREDVELDRALCQRWGEEEQEERTLAAFFKWATRQLAPGWGFDPEGLYPTPRRAFGSRAQR